MQPYLDRELTDARARRGRGAPRRLLVLPQALPLRGAAAPLRAARGAGADAARAEGRGSRRSASASRRRSSGRSTSPGDAEVVAGDERGGERARALVRDAEARPRARARPGGRGRRRRSRRRARRRAPARRRRRGRPRRVELGPVGEDDDRGLGVAERSEAAAQRRARAALPVGAVDDAARRSRPRVRRARRRRHRPRRSPRSALEHAGGSRTRCFGEPKRVAAPAASTTAATTRRQLDRGRSCDRRRRLRRLLGGRVAELARSARRRRGPSVTLPTIA